MTVSALVMILLAAEPAPTSPFCVTTVSEHFSAQRFAAAAVTGEQCWTHVRDPEALLYATQARINLGHGAQAALDLRRFIAATKVEEQAAVPWARQQIQGLVVDVGVDFTPSAIAKGTLQMRFLDQDRGLLLVGVDELASGASGRELALDRGLWEFKLFHGPTLIAEATIEAKEGAMVTLAQPQAEEEPLEDVTTPPDPTPPVVDKPARRVPIGRVTGYGSAAALGTAIGIGLIASAAREPRDLDDVPLQDQGDVVDEWLSRARRTYFGAAFLGAGVGSGIVLSTELAKAKRRAFIAEAAAGGAVALGGAIYAAISITSYNRDASAGEKVDGDFFRARYGHEIASGMLLGLGTGLVSSAAISLISRSVAGRRRRR